MEPSARRVPASLRDAKAWVLTGPSLEANNLTDPDTVKITPLEVFKTDEGLKLTLPPFSMAAVETALAEPGEAR